MKLNQKHTLAALIAITLVASGCASGGGDTGEPGSATAPIAVTEFNAFPNPATPNQKVTFTLSLQNTGSGVAENVVATLSNPPFADSDTDDRVWRSYPDSGDAEDAGAVSESYRTFSFGNLESDTGGFSSTETISFMSPNLGSNLDNFPYQFFADIYYQYETNGSTTITVMGSEEFRDSGQSASQAIPISHNAAPITLSGTIGTGNPVVYYPNQDGSSKEIEMCLTVSNDGPGSVFYGAQFSNGDYNINDDHRNKVRLTVQTLGNTYVKYQGDSSYNQETTESETVDLIEGESTRECFMLQATDLTSSLSQREIGPIQVQAEYGYQKSTQYTMNVEPR